MMLMVKLKLKVGPKGQIALPKIFRDKLGIKPYSYVIADVKEEEISLQRGLDSEELLNWLRESRKLVAKLVSKISLEDEMLDGLSTL
ncbi:MAG: AbrB/MazE/SpoVT family DNA-binding domain-containing protein [Candidatus Bathyarchaeia archaeon]